MSEAFLPGNAHKGHPASHLSGAWDPPTCAPLVFTCGQFALASLSAPVLHQRNLAPFPPGLFPAQHSPAAPRICSFPLSVCISHPCSNPTLSFIYRVNQKCVCTKGVPRTGRRRGISAPLPHQKGLPKHHRHQNCFVASSEQHIQVFPLAGPSDLKGFAPADASLLPSRCSLCLCSSPHWHRHRPCWCCGAEGLPDFSWHGSKAALAGWKSPEVDERTCPALAAFLQPLRAGRGWAGGPPGPGACRVASLKAKRGRKSGRSCWHPVSGEVEEAAEQRNGLRRERSKQPGW